MANQAKFGQKKALNLTVNQRNHGWRIIIWICFEHITKEILLLLKDLLEDLFIRKNKIYKYMTSISKNLYIDKLNDTVNKYSNTYHKTIEMKPVKRKILNLNLVTM